jgi:hypothetical protein
MNFLTYFFSLSISEGLFAAHLKCREHFLVMVAKSDTARLSGPGVQGQQEATYGIYKNL